MNQGLAAVPEGAELAAYRLGAELGRVALPEVPAHTALGDVIIEGASGADELVIDPDDQVLECDEANNRQPEG